MKRSLPILLAVAGLSCAAFSGCRQYDATIYDRAQDYASETFLRENITEGAHFIDGSRADDTYPEEIEYVVRTQAEFDEMFPSFPDKINFDEEMALVYVFTCNYMGRAYEIESIGIDAGTTLEIDVESVRPSGCGMADASVPMQRCIVVKMEKLDITEVDFD